MNSGHYSMLYTQASKPLLSRKIYPWPLKSMDFVCQGWSVMLLLAAKEHFDPKAQMPSPSQGIFNSSTFRPKTTWYYTTMQEKGKVSVERLHHFYS